MESILKNSKTETVDMLVEMIFGEMKASEIMEIQNLTEELKRKFIMERMREICEEFC